MKLNEIKNKWNFKERDIEASIEMWDSMAEQFSEFEMPTLDNSSLLQLIIQRNMLDMESTVLDVGCGAGKYSLALAHYCQHVIGLDLSPKMIQKANQKKNEMGIKNVDFHVNNWHGFNCEKMGYKQKFDLVIANMTPAVRNAETFMKLIEVCKGHCVMSKPIKRTDPVSDAIIELLSIKEKKESADVEVLYSFEILWLNGILPEITYEKQKWNMKKPIDHAYKFYSNRMKSYRQLSKNEQDKIKEYLISISLNGFVEETVDTTIATMFWKANN